MTTTVPSRPPGRGNPRGGVPSAPGPFAAPLPGRTPSGAARPLSLSGRARAAAAGRLAGTPGRLRVLAALTVVASLLFAVSAGQAFRARADALERARNDVAQLVLLQSVSTNLARADAAATSAFLHGGIPPAALDRDYDASLAAAGTQLARAAAGQQADGEALAVLNDVITRYAALVATARADNRQLVPLGAEYLRQASGLLQREGTPALDALLAANERRVEAEFDASRTATAWLALGALLGLAGLVGGSVWLARRTRRVLNPPLALASLAVLVATVAGGALLASTGDEVTDVRDGAYAATLTGARVRIAAFDARAQEALTLIARGSGQAYEQAWARDDATVRAGTARLAALTASARALPATWEDYAQAHREIRSADDAGRWDSAVAAATREAPTSASGRFAVLDAESARVLQASAGHTATGLDGARAGLLAAGLALLLAGIVAAGLAAWGVSLRLGEYR